MIQHKIPSSCPQNVGVVVTVRGVKPTSDVGSASKRLTTPFAKKTAETPPRRSTHSTPFQSLGSQNDKLKSNYEAVRTELVQLREKHNTTRKQLLEAVESRVSADQRTETLVHKWKVQLEARTKELESLQAKLVPQDLDMLRAKVQEELEVPQQRRVAMLESEVEKHRQMFCKARREHERCKVSQYFPKLSVFSGARMAPKGALL